MKVLVLGSINMDLVVKTPRLPQAGETLIGHEFFSTFGGKGANQAVALARLGIPVAFIGKVGGDDFGETLQLALHAAKVETTGLGVDPEVNSGVASIVVSATGENTIACAAGANSTVGEMELAYLRQQLPEAAWLIMDLGIPMAVVGEAIAAAQAAQVPVLIDPAPATEPLPLEFCTGIEILTPNEVEASQLVGFPVRDPESAAAAAAVIQGWGITTVLITLGGQGVWWAGPEGAQLIPALPVEVVDTVAAGDAFNGALIAALVEGKTVGEAIAWGNAAGALAVTKSGAQPSLPSRATLLDFLS
ncbi:MAG: ribokinase [Spirulina sp. DLM2.Bin59]|nr:MAG: ribokinase [Spirulina sp. DLM2.Bin59]